jgi:anthranilate/para-aminobenzoate synthase component I
MTTKRNNSIKAFLRKEEHEEQVRLAYEYIKSGDYAKFYYDKVKSLKEAGTPEVIDPIVEETLNEFSYIK